MATLYVTEFSGIREQGGVVQAALRPALRQQTIVIAGASAQAAKVFTPETHLIRVHTDAICSIAVGANPIATVADSRMAADQTEYFSVRPGDNVAVITNT